MEADTERTGWMPKTDAGQGFTFEMTGPPVDCAYFACASWPTDRMKIDATSEPGTGNPWKARYTRMMKADAIEREREKAEARERVREKKDRQSQAATALARRDAADRMAFVRAMEQLEYEDASAGMEQELNKIRGRIAGLRDKVRAKEIATASKLDAAQVTGRERALAKMRAKKKLCQAVKILAGCSSVLMDTGSKNRIQRLLLRFRENCWSAAQVTERERASARMRVEKKQSEAARRLVGCGTVLMETETCFKNRIQGLLSQFRENCWSTAQGTGRERPSARMRAAKMMARCYSGLMQADAKNRMQRLLLLIRERFTGEKEAGHAQAGHSQAAPRDVRASGRRDRTDNRAAVMRAMKGIAGLQDRRKSKTGKKKMRRRRMRADGLGSQGRQVPPAAGEREKAAYADGLGSWDRRMPPAAGSEDGWNKTDGIPKVRWDK
jgi:hypothetical protein